MNHEVAMGERAKEILVALSNGTTGITFLYTDRTDLPPLDDAQAWVLTVNTDRNESLTFWMEGFNIAGCKELVDAGGHRLVDTHNQLAVTDWLSGPEACALDQTVMTAIAQVLAT